MAIIPDECKFHVVSESVDTVDRGSKLAQSKRESITMADIKQSIPTPVGIFERSTGECSIVPVVGNNIVETKCGTISGGYDNCIVQSGTDYGYGSDVISGGSNNQINSSYATGGNVVSGGYYNTIKNENTADDGCLYNNTIGGGKRNCISTQVCYSVHNTIVGGTYNYVRGEAANNTITGSGNSMCAYNSQTDEEIGRTSYNSITGNDNSIDVGRCNGGEAGANGIFGDDNVIRVCGDYANACYNTISGYGNAIRVKGGTGVPNSNCDASACYSILSGYRNYIKSASSDVYSSRICASTISGGVYNSICTDNGGDMCANTIGGGYCNSIKLRNGSAYMQFNTISGGYCNYFFVSEDAPNSCISNGTIGGGYVNSINVYDPGDMSCGATISGGGCNFILGAESSYATISGGYGNCIDGAESKNATIIGGYYNCIYGDASCDSTIGGGYCNRISGTASNTNVIGGGADNRIYGGYTASAVIAGGKANCISGNLSYHTLIGGGYTNQICGDYAPRSIIVGGADNTIDNGNTSVIGGGRYNAINGAYHSGIMSGKCNVINGGYASVQTILGGYNNTNGSYESHVLGSNITTDRVCTAFVNNLSIKSIPTVVTGLPAGSVWNNAGVLNIV